MRVGYVRVSTVGQNTARQEVLMEELGAERVYIDRMSGKNTSRPALRQMLEFVREGDVVVVESISRFALPVICWSWWSNCLPKVWSSSRRRRPSTR